MSHRDIKPVGWQFTDSNGILRQQSVHGFNAYTSAEDAVESARAYKSNRRKVALYVYRMDDGLFDYSYVSASILPWMQTAELVETVEV